MTFDSPLVKISFFKKNHFQHRHITTMARNPVTWLTRELRTRIALRYIPRAGVHLDIGCGPEKYLLRKSPCANRIGFDKQLGEFITDTLPTQTDSMDCITMLAVIEHMDYPLLIIKECHRILKDSGILIITTPKAKGHWIMKLYDPTFPQREGPHKTHYDRHSLSQLLAGYFSVVEYRTFAFGFNQLFVCHKVRASS